MAGVVTITLHSAEGLKETEVISPAERKAPYAVIQVGRQQQKTEDKPWAEVHAGPGRVVWETEFTFTDVPDMVVEATVNIFQHSVFTEDHLGYVTIPLVSVRERGEVEDKYQLVFQGHTQASVAVKLRYEPTKTLQRRSSFAASAYAAAEQGMRPELTDSDDDELATTRAGPLTVTAPPQQQLQEQWQRQQQEWANAGGSVCGACMQVTPPNAKFCVRCGTRLGSDASMRQPSGPYFQPGPAGPPPPGYPGTAQNGYYPPPPPPPAAGYPGYPPYQQPQYVVVDDDPYRYGNRYNTSNSRNNGLYLGGALLGGLLLGDILF
eukprot:jgi/Chlat1/4228/Chrsp27S04308